jgi:hypothetical protein
MGSNENPFVIVYVNPPLTTVAATRLAGSGVPVESFKVNAGFGTVVPFATEHAEQIWPSERLKVPGDATLTENTCWPLSVATLTSPVDGSSSLTPTVVLSPGMSHV